MFSRRVVGIPEPPDHAEGSKGEAVTFAPEPVRASSKGARGDASLSTQCSTNASLSTSTAQPAESDDVRRLETQPIRPARKIRKMCEADFCEEYQTGNKVMTSGHRGVHVLFATRVSDSASLVVKTMSKDSTFGGCRNAMRRWREVMEGQLSLPKSRVLCEIIEVIETEERFCVVMERAGGQDLRCWAAASKARWKNACVMSVMRQILQAVQVMHDVGQVHRDLKMDNVVLNMDPTRQDNASILVAKVIDFDTAEAWHEGAAPANHVVGSTGYIAPEAHRGLYSPASDMYSVGVIMYRLLTRSFPVDPKLIRIERGENVVGHASLPVIQKCLEEAEINYECAPLDSCPEAVALLKSLLAVDPASRPSAEEALAHEWFATANSASR